MPEQRDLPPILDFDDELDRLEREADADVSDDLDELRTRLDEMAERAANGEEVGSLVSDAETDLYALRERLSGDADRQAEAILNRLEIYEDSQAERSETLSVADARFEQGGREVDFADHRGEPLTFAGTLTNAGDMGHARVRLSFYGHDDRTVRVVEVPEREVEADEKREVEVEVLVPESVEYYDVTVVDETTGS
ncbi:hypothetical protein ACFO0N_14555 [Halobium salinum]|uniref:Uncharacterized protein n=1 Tax=Halobium salinum TaxID=1364940 RepID=A0ABD5PE53_9EURY|nr:hypothetical protein [Halobium salinum]